MSREDHVYDRQEDVDITTQGVLAGLDDVEGDCQGLPNVSIRATTDTAVTFDLEVSNDGTNWWVHASYSSASDLDKSETISERFVRLKNTSTGSGSDTGTAEITASA